MLRRLLVALVVMSTGLFVLGVSIEKSSRDGEPTRPQAGVAAEDEEGHGEERGEGGAAETGESAEASATEENERGAEETVFGVDLEATPLVALAAAGSLALAAAVAAVVALVAVVMVAFAALDVREVVHQLGEANTGLALVAAAVAALHLMAGTVAATMGVRSRRAI